MEQDIYTGKCLIDNIWQSNSDKNFDSINPYSNKVIWEGFIANNTDVDMAISAARASLKKWASLEVTERQVYIEKFINILKKNKDYIAEVISREMGKPFWESKSEVDAMIAKYDISVKAYHERTGLKETRGAVSSKLIHKPHGVLAVFGPFNFPGHLPNGHIIPALLAGNTIVFKPSELTPLTGEVLGKLWVEVGLPKGVLNIVQGDASTGKLLIEHDDINGVLFTGSYNTGLIINKGLANKVDKILALEMGGNNPLIISNTKDLKGAVYNTIVSAFITSGQRCTCARRLIVPDNSFGDDFIELLIKAIKNIKIGDPFDKNEPFMGTVISKDSKNNLLNYFKQAVDMGADPLVNLESLNNENALISPGILDISNIKDINKLDKEHFGPILSIKRYNEFDEAINIANNTNYGLSAGLISDEREEFDKFLFEIKAGIVNWNRPTTGASSAMPFGGIGFSGNHRPSAYYAADYCAYPVASMMSDKNTLPDSLMPGISF